MIAFNLYLYDMFSIYNWILIISCYKPFLESITSFSIVFKVTKINQKGVILCLGNKHHIS